MPVFVCSRSSNLTRVGHTSLRLALKVVLKNEYDFGCNTAILKWMSDKISSGLLQLSRNRGVQPEFLKHVNQHPDSVRYATY